MHLLVDLDLVVGDLILCSECHLILWSNTVLEYELVSSVVLEIEVALLLCWDYIADVVNLLCLQILECCIRSLAVSLLCNSALAVHLLDYAHRNHTLTESWNVCLAAVLFEHLLNLSCVVSLLNNDAEQCCTQLFLYFCNVHSVLCVICLNFPFRLMFYIRGQR